MPPALPTFPNLLDKVAFITGSGQTPVAGIDDEVWGNGAAIARVLATNEVKLFGCDPDLDSANRTVSRIRTVHQDCAINVVSADVTKLSDVQAAVDACIAKHGRIES